MLFEFLSSPPSLCSSRDEGLLFPAAPRTPSRTVSPPLASVTWAGFSLVRLRATSHLHPPCSWTGRGGGALREPLPLLHCSREWKRREVCGCPDAKVDGQRSPALVQRAFSFFLVGLSRAFAIFCLLFLEGVGPFAFTVVIALWFFHLMRKYS